MCLQWCHTTKRLIDNDLPCLDCTHFPQHGAPAGESCATCIHRVASEDTAPFCGLSKAPIPLRAHCCHWNVERESRPILLLSDADVAPGVLDMWGVTSIAALFAHSDSAPEVSVEGDGRVQVALDDLAIPLVYGVPAAHWEAALVADGGGWAADVRVDVPSEVAAAVVALLDALGGQMNADGDAAYEALYDALSRHPVGALPDPWPAMITEALGLYAAREVHTL